MKSAYTKSIVKIRSVENGRTDFGTGFIIDYIDDSTYIVTCAHVINAVGGINNVRIGDYPDEVEVIAIGDSAAFDVAVLKISRQFEKNTALRVCLCNEEAEKFTICGWNRIAEHFTITSICGRLTLYGEIEENNLRTEAYKFEVEDRSENLLKPGYSGAPVINEKNDCVAGIVFMEHKEGQEGICISINSVIQICPELYNLISKSELELRNKKLSRLLAYKMKIEQEVQNEEEQIKVLQSKLSYSS